MHRLELVRLSMAIWIEALRAALPPLTPDSPLLPDLDDEEEPGTSIHRLVRVLDRADCAGSLAHSFAAEQDLGSPGRG
jgi:hypothetical protein